MGVHDKTRQPVMLDLDPPYEGNGSWITVDESWVRQICTRRAERELGNRERLTEGPFCADRPAAMLAASYAHQRPWRIALFADHWITSFLGFGLRPRGSLPRSTWLGAGLFCEMFVFRFDCNLLIFNRDELRCFLGKKLSLNE